MAGHHQSVSLWVLMYEQDLLQLREAKGGPLILPPPQVTVYMKQGPGALQSFRNAQDEAMGSLMQGPAAATLVFVDGFARPELLVEVEAVAAR